MLSDTFCRRVPILNTGRGGSRAQKHSGGCASSHLIASELAGDTGTIVCTHEHAAEKPVGLGRMASGGWGRRNTLHSEHRARADKPNFLKVGKLRTWPPSTDVHWRISRADTIRMVCHGLMRLVPPHVT